MKKLSIISLVVLFGALLGISVAKADTSFTKDLYYGIQGDSDVTQLQEFLTAQGVYSGPISSNFFSLTLAGVKQFQNTQGITPAAGYFGPITRARANTILSQQLQGSNEQAISETSSTPPVPIKPATTNDVNNSLQAQLNVLIQQVALLQQQLAAQQQTNQTLQQIQQNTTSAPSPTPTPTPPQSQPAPQPAGDLTVERITSGPDMSVFRIKAINDSFRLEVMNIVGPIDDEGPITTTPFYLSRRDNVAIIDQFTILSCYTMSNYFQQYARVEYLDQCPGKELSVNGTIDVPAVLTLKDQHATITYTSPKIDWHGDSRYNVIFQSGSTYEIAFSTNTANAALISIRYLKTTNLRTGETIEKTL